MIETKATNSHPRRNRLLSRRNLLVLGCLAAILLIPFPTEVVPEWRIRVVDESGKPHVEKFVRQGWAHDSLEFGGGDTDDRWTDENGYVVFPRRVIWASLLRRIVAPIVAGVLTLAHGGTGIHASVIVWDGNNYPKSVEYEPGKSLPKEIVLRQ